MLVGKNTVYQNKKTKAVYFVNSVTETTANVSTVLVNKQGGMYQVLTDTKNLPLDVFENFYRCGNYTREIIND